MIADDSRERAELVFREQEDGKKVAFLEGGKCVIVAREEKDRVTDGETWRVRLRHFDSFAIATLVERVKVAVVPAPAARATKSTFEGKVAEVLEKVKASPPAPATPATAVASPPPQAAPAVAMKKAESEKSKAQTVKVVASGPAPTKVQGKLVEPFDVIASDERVAFFVDSANMEIAARDVGFWIDWRKVRDFFLARGVFSQAYYYTAEYVADEDQKSFLRQLANEGFIVRSKPVKRVFDHTEGQERWKANLDVELVLDMVAAEDHYDVAILFSGDGDFKRAVELLQSRGKRVYVVSTRKTLAHELLMVADKPVFHLEDYVDHIKRE